eukprot:CAMPEP_0202449670 /NCGR_PEP_ID=MMETSP1360-20130828/8391_1 /ASSEMBLY_ACC=CAM_ASM_000848 /TAXON_ID=515479 /ORGANISM="Licmophora paradoxa, Strain CCMP2313" /LENGTH=127 /DNA_ID=CAMNT_0049067671 /DNA_START=34 /DNA_END=413 /DNA_ORIENTATION=+
MRFGRRKRGTGTGSTAGTGADNDDSSSLSSYSSCCGGILPLLLIVFTFNYMISNGIIVMGDENRGGYSYINNSNSNSNKSLSSNQQDQILHSLNKTQWELQSRVKKLQDSWNHAQQDIKTTATATAT